MYTVAKGMIPAAVPLDNYLIPLENNGQVRPKRSEDVRTIGKHRRPTRKKEHSLLCCMKIETTKTAIFRNRFSKDNLIVGWDKIWKTEQTALRQLRDLDLLS